MKILIIDDEINVARLLADAVRCQGHDATVVHDGEEGLALLGQFRPDAVFLDVRMPGLGGLGFLRRIRKTDSALPVIIITGHATPSELAEARLLGVTEILEKPDFLNRLTKALDALRTRA